MLYKNYMVLPIAFVIVLILSFNVFAQDKTSSKLDCEPLPEAERFKALGYELGTCKSDVELLIDKHSDSNNFYKSDDFGSEFDSTIYDSILEILNNTMNADAPEKISYIITKFSNAKPPYLNLLSEPLDLMLTFYDNTLLVILYSATYKKTSKGEFVNIYTKYAETLLTKYSKNKDGKEPTKEEIFNPRIKINYDNLDIYLYVDDMDSRIIHIIYNLQKYSDWIDEAFKNKRIKEKKIESEKNKRREQMEGF